MKLRVTEEQRFLQIIESTKLEMNQTDLTFTKKVDNWWILKKKLEEKGRDTSGWCGEVKFMDRYNRIPIGLWVELVNMGKKFNFPVQIENPEALTDKDFDPEDFNEWVNEYFDGAVTDKGKLFYPYKYQLESARKALKYRFCTEEISTSGGKTLISFMIFRYLLDRKKIKKLLYVVPSVDLVTQSYDAWLEYDENCGNEYGEMAWKGEMVFGKARKTGGGPKQVTFGTYQTLNNKDLDYFTDYDAIIVDETHHAKAASIKKIITKCYFADKYRIGLTGTLPKEGTCDFFTIQAYLGPKVHVVYSADLIDDKKATPIKVICLELSYLKQEVRENLYNLRNVPAAQKDGAKLLNLEKDLARESRLRFNYIVETISKSTKNTLVLFADVKNGYGRRIYDWIRANTDKQAYYVDGGTQSDNREHAKSQMEESDNIVLVASVGTFSEGIDIKNVHSIFITESHKSEFIVRQILGRGMRLMDGKEEVLVIDFSDNFSFGNNKYHKTNYLMKHANERARIYREKRFPFKKFKIQLPVNKKGVF